MAQAGQRVDPYGSFDFLVEIDGITRASFQEVSGLESTIDTMDYREGGENETMRRLPAKTKFVNIVCKWGTTDNPEMSEWHRQWVVGDPAAARKNGSVVLLDRQGNEKVRWNFVNAWPSKYVGPSFNAKNSDVAIETMEIVHEGITRV
ncbi:MAG TPA: phage tail protein [Verrucomicrobiae bacterium]|nr:phage tail protein [Verrucomicrobiae bacterium]